MSAIAAPVRELPDRRDGQPDGLVEAIDRIKTRRAKKTLTIASVLMILAECGVVGERR